MAHEQYQQRQRVLREQEQAQAQEQAEAQARAQERKRAQEREGGGGGEQRSHARPKGRAPKGKAWDAVAGEWVDAQEQQQQQQQQQQQAGQQQQQGQLHKRPKGRARKNMVWDGVAGVWVDKEEQQQQQQQHVPPAPAQPKRTAAQRKAAAVASGGAVGWRVQVWWATEGEVSGRRRPCRACVPHNAAPPPNLIPLFRPSCFVRPAQWFPGFVHDYKVEKDVYVLRYDDGETEEVSLPDANVQLIEPKGPAGSGGR